MDTRATYGNNPYMRIPKPMPVSSRRGNRGRSRGGRAVTAPRRGGPKLKSLFVYDEGLRTSEEQSAVEYIVGRDEEQMMEPNSGVTEDYLQEVRMCGGQAGGWWTHEDTRDNMVIRNHIYSCKKIPVPYYITEPCYDELYTLDQDLL